MKYGWVPDLPDHRDLKFTAPMTAMAAETLPSSVDLRPLCPPVYNQGQLGSCTANAIAGAIQFDQLKQKVVTPFNPSRLFIYYNERVMENTVASDSGAMIRDGIKSVAQQGVPPESMWSYDESMFATAPSADAVAAAQTHLVTAYHSVAQDLIDMKTCLAAGFPFVFGFSVYADFESDQVATTGILGLPGHNESQLGGHAVLCVGYNDETQRFIVRNSWGNSWGQQGYFEMPYDYLTNPDMADDFWVINFTS
jgi:C1A family cysteine protease